MPGQVWTLAENGRDRQSIVKMSSRALVWSDFLLAENFFSLPYIVRAVYKNDSNFFNYIKTFVSLYIFYLFYSQSFLIFNLFVEKIKIYKIKINFVKITNFLVNNELKY